MAAYVIVDIDVHDPERYADYVRAAPATIARFGGRYIVRGGKAEKLEGAWDPKRVVVLEFATAERAREWWASAEYAEPKRLRQSTAAANMIVVEGV
jgi:uncharacterized protein (DUF1330 family)